MTVSFHKFGDLFFPGTGDVKVLINVFLCFLYLYLLDANTTDLSPGALVIILLFMSIFSELLNVWILLLSVTALQYSMFCHIVYVFYFKFLLLKVFSVTWICLHLFSLLFGNVFISYCHFLAKVEIGLINKNHSQFLIEGNRRKRRQVLRYKCPAQGWNWWH